MKYSAIDLHSNNNVLVVTDEADRVLIEKRLPNELTRILELLDPHKDELAGVVVESTYNWYWLVDGLMSAGFDVKLANTGAIKSYDGLKYSGDEADAIATMGLPDDVARGMAANVAVIQTLGAEIEKLEARLLDAVKQTDAWPLLNSIPGIGKVLATIILLEIGHISRFRDVGNFASYARCVDSKRISNGKKKGQGNTKNGNEYLAWAFVEAAHFAARFCPEAKRFYQRKFAKTNGAVATKALAHKLARACYHMMKTGQTFDVKRCFAG